MPVSHGPSGHVSRGAMMAGLAVLLFALAVTIPVLGSVLRFFVAVPVALAVVTGQVGTAVVSAAAATLIIAMLLGPLSAWQFLTWFALSGVILGVAVKGGAPFHKTFLWTASGILGGMAVYFLSLAFLLDWDVQTLINQVNQIKDQVYTMYEETGILEALEQQSLSAVTEFRIMLEQTTYYMIRLIPSFFIGAGILQAVLQYWGVNRVMGAMQEPTRPLPPFRNWHFPAVLMVPLLGAWALFLARSALPWQWLEVPVLNVLFLSLLMVAIDGLAYLFYRFTLRPMSPLMKVLMVVFVIFFFNGVVIVAVLAGMFDMLLDFRRRLYREKE